MTSNNSSTNGREGGLVEEDAALLAQWAGKEVGAGVAPADFDGAIINMTSSSSSSTNGREGGLVEENAALLAQWAGKEVGAGVAPADFDGASINMTSSSSSTNGREGGLVEEDAALLAQWAGEEKGAAGLMSGVSNPTTSSSTSSSRPSAGGVIPSTCFPSSDSDHDQGSTSSSSHSHVGEVINPWILNDMSAEVAAEGTLVIAVTTTNSSSSSEPSSGNGHVSIGGSATAAGSSDSNVVDVVNPLTMNDASTERAAEGTIPQMVITTPSSSYSTGPASGDGPISFGGANSSSSYSNGPASGNGPISIGGSNSSSSYSNVMDVVKPWWEQPLVKGRYDACIGGNMSRAKRNVLIRSGRALVKAAGAITSLYPYFWG
jgi:hypothetical protein